jgi:hypothetical protein
MALFIQRSIKSAIITRGVSEAGLFTSLDTDP